MTIFSQMNTNREFQQIMDKLEQIVSMLKKQSEKKDILNSEELLDNADLCALLNITKRTLQRYRQKGLVTYYMIAGKPYYKAGEVKESLRRIVKDNYYKFNFRYKIK